MVSKTYRLIAIERDAEKIAAANNEILSDLHMLLAIARGKGVGQNVLANLGLDVTKIQIEAQNQLALMYFI